MECRAAVRLVAPVGVRDRAAKGGFDLLSAGYRSKQSQAAVGLSAIDGDGKGCRHPQETPSLVSGTSTRSASE